MAKGVKKADLIEALVYLSDAVSYINDDSLDDPFSAEDLLALTQKLAELAKAKQNEDKNAILALLQGIRVTAKRAEDRHRKANF